MGEAATGSSGIDGGYLQRQWSKLSLFQVNLMCLMVVLVMTGALSWTDMLYPIGSAVYIAFFAIKDFPPVSDTEPANPFKGNKIFTYYVSFGGLIGFLIPAIFILLAFIWGDREAAASAVPHVYLLVAQVLTEGLSRDPAISGPIKVLIPASYNTKRLANLLHWVRSATAREIHSVWTLPWQVFEGVLALANLVFWSYNLLGFLLPVYLPIQFRSYYQQEADRRKSDVKQQ